MLNNRDKEKVLGESGHTLPEMLIYIFVLAIIIIVVVNAIILIGSSYRQIRATTAIEQASIVTMDRMIREIRDATSVNVASSVLDVHPGVLFLNNATTTRFYTSNSILQIDEGGTPIGAMHQSEVTVANLIFRHDTVGNAEIVKIEMTLESGRDSWLKSEKFYTTVRVRN